MPKFNPAAVILDINDKPIRFGEPDTEAVVKARALEIKIAKATDEKNNEQVVRFRHELAILEEISVPAATLGSVAMKALLMSLPKGDDPREAEILNEAVRLDHVEWAMKIRRAEMRGEMVEFDNATWTKVWARITKAFRSAELIWRFKQEVTAKEPGLAASDTDRYLKDGVLSDCA